MKPTAFDFETYLISPGQLAPKPVCLAAADEKGGDLFVGERMSSTLNALLRGDRLLIGTKVAYDLGVWCAWYPSHIDHVLDLLESDRVEDIQINQRMIDNAHGNLGGIVKGGKVVKKYGYSLAALEARHLGNDRSASKGPDAWRLRYAELDGVPLDQWPDEARQYPIDDAVGTLAVWQAQQKELDELASNRHAQVRADFALHLMACWGVHTDARQIERLRNAIADEYESLTAQLKDAGLLRPNGTKDTKLAKSLMIQACETVKLTKTGQEKHGCVYVPSNEAPIKYVALDADTCEASGDPLLQAYARRTTLSRVMDTTIPDLLKGAGNEPIQPRYNVFLETGRTSCFKDSRSLNGFQVQNVMRHISKEHEAQGIGVRECFRARPGMLFIDCDYSQLELCCVAQVLLDWFGESTLADLINSGRDVHASVEANILGRTYEWVIDNADDPIVEFTRVLAKISNFGFWGGLGGQGIVGFARGYGVNMTVARGKELKEQWREAMYPDADRYFALIREAIDPTTELIPLQEFRNGVLRGNVRYTAACNGEFQALGAAVAKEAAWRVAREAYRSNGRLPGVRPWGFVHDQIISEAPAQHARELAQVKSEIMLAAAKEHLPDITIKCEPAISEYWFKGAKGIERVWYPKEWPMEKVVA